MLNIPYLTDASPLSTVTTKEVVIEAAQTITVVSGEGVLLKNGVAQSSPCDYAVGDKLQVQVVAEVSGHTVFVVLSSNIDYDTSVVAVSSKDSIDYKVYPYVRNLRAVDIIEDNNGIGFIPNTEEDKLVVGSDMPNVYELDLPDTAPYSMGLRFLLTDCLGYRARLFDVNGKCCYERNFDAHPVGPWCLYGSKFAVCIPADDSVLFITLGATILERTVTDFVHPVSASLYASKAWVGHFGGVSRYGVAVEFTVALPNVREVLAVSDDKCFVTTSDGQYGFVTSAGFTKLGDAYVRAECLHNDNILFIEGDVLHCIDSNGNAVSSYTFDSEAFPASITSNGSEIAVGEFGHNGITFLNADLTFKSKYSFGYNTPYGLAYVGATLVAAGLYVNRPPALYVVDKLAAGFDLTDSSNVGRAQTVTTSSFTVDRLEPEFPVQASVPNVLGATIIKNGVHSGLSTSVVKGDVLAVSIQTPVLPEVGIKVPLFVGQVYDDLTSNTAPYDVTPDAFAFTDRSGIASGSTVTSEEVTISGVDADAGAVLSVSTGALYKNGTPVGQSWTTVVNGDKIKVSVVAPSTTNASVISVITAGKFRLDWAVSTPASDQSYIAESLIYTDEQSWPVSGSDLQNSVAVVPLDMSGVTRIDLSTDPTGDTYNSEAVALITDLGASNLYEVNTELSTFQRSLPVAGIVGSFAINAGMGGDISIFTVTATKIQGFDSDYTPLWGAVSHGYTDVVDAIGVNGGTSLYLAHSDGTVTNHTFNYATGYITDADATYDIGARRLLHGVVNKKEYAFAFGTSITQIFPTVGSPINQPCTTLAFDETLLYTVDRYSNEVRSYALSDGSLVQAVKQPFACGDLTLSGSILVAADLSAHRVVRLDEAFKEIAAVQLQAGPVDLTATPTTVYAYERRSNLPENSIVKDLPKITGPSETSDAALGSTVTETVTLADAARSVAPVLGSLSVSSPVSNGVIKVSAPASGDYFTAATSKMAVGSTVYSLTTKTVANTTPDPLFFNRLYDAVVSTIAESNTQTISGMTDGVFTTLSVDAPNTTAELVVNGVVSGTSTQVKNGDVVSVRVIAEGPYGSTHTYAVSANSVKVGSFIVTDILLGDAIKFPAMNVRRTKLYPSKPVEAVTEKLLYAPVVVATTSVGIEAPMPSVQTSHPEVFGYEPIKEVGEISTVAAHNSSQVTYHLGEYELNKGERIQGSLMTGNLPDQIKLTAEIAEAQQNTFEVLVDEIRVKDKQTPFFIRPHMFMGATKRIEAIHTVEHHSEDVSKLYSMSAHKMVCSDAYDWDVVRTHRETVSAVYDRAVFNWNFGDADWVKYVCNRYDVDAQYERADPTSWYRADTDWSSYGRRIAEVAAEFDRAYSHREEFDRGSSTFATHREEFSASPVLGSRVSSFEFASVGQKGDAGTEAMFSASPVRAAPVSYKLATASWTHTTNQVHAFSGYGICRISEHSSTVTTSAKVLIVNNLKTFKALQQSVIADPLWVEPPLPSPESKGIFSTKLLAEEDAQAQAKHKYRAVQFKDAYFWNEDVDVMTKTCYSFGSMSRTPYKWNMQLRNCWADAKQSGYMGGG